MRKVKKEKKNVIGNIVELLLIPNDDRTVSDTIGDEIKSFGSVCRRITIQLCWGQARPVRKREKNLRGIVSMI